MVRLPETAGRPAGFDIEAIRRELSAEDHRDALLPKNFVANDLPDPEDHTDEIKAEMMRLLEAAIRRVRFAIPGRGAAEANGRSETRRMKLEITNKSLI